MLNKRLIGLIGGSIRYVYYTVILNLISLLFNIAFVYGIATISMEIYKESSYLYSNEFKNLSLVIIASIFFRYIASKFASKYSFYSSVEVKKSLRKKIFNKLIDLGSDYKNKITDSEVTQVTVEGVEQLELYYSQFLPQFFYSMIAPIILFVFLSFYSFRAALVMIICVPLIPLSIVMVMKYAKKLLASYWNTYSDLGGRFLDNIQGLTSLKIYQRDNDYSKQMDCEAERFRKITMKVLSMQLNSLTIMDVIAFGGSAIGCVIALTQLGNGLIDIRSCIIVILLSAEFFIPLRLLGSFFHVSMNGIAASEKIFKILDMKKVLATENEFPLDFDKISIKSLSYSYNKDRLILEDINFNIMKNSLTSIVGESGSGKSTIAKILRKINKGYKGSIKFGDIELRDIDDKSLVNNICIVSNSNHIFKGTVRENLLFAKKNASKEDMIRVLRQVNLYDFFYENDGLDTKILENASNLSGGQKQRLSIARALLKDSKIYIFDEATSNIDVESEEIIMNIIFNMSKNKTVIVISHSLMNVMKADKIMVLKDGKLVECADHDSLMNNRKTYYEMFEKQRQLENLRKDFNDEKARL